MEHNRDVKESPDRWHMRFLKAARPHGRFAVISSSATVGALLILGGVVFASQDSDRSTDLSSARTTVTSTATGTEAGALGNANATVTTTTVPGSIATTVPEFGPQGTLTTNTTSSGTPTTN